VQSWRRVPLPHSNVKGHGNYLEAELSFAGGTLHLLLTHVDRRRDRQAQLAAVLARFAELPTPAVLLGDLNSTAEEPQLQELLAGGDVGDPLSLPGAWGERPRYDWILTRGLRVLAAGVTDSAASDHPAFWVEVAPPR
jgi:endonuclease/exonuclease/phosphatase family metal-dependent hydrolase